MESDDSSLSASQRLKNLTDALSEDPDFEELEEDWQIYAAEEGVAGKRERLVRAQSEEEATMLAMQGLKNLIDSLSEDPDFEELEEDWQTHSAEERIAEEGGRVVAVDHEKARPGEEKPKNDVHPKTQ